MEKAEDHQVFPLEPRERYLCSAVSARQPSYCDRNSDIMVRSHITRACDESADANIVWRQIPRQSIGLTRLGGYIANTDPTRLQIDVGRSCLGGIAAERALRGIAMRRLLPSSTVCKHCKLIFVIDAIRATFARSRRPPVRVADRRPGLGLSGPRSPFFPHHTVLCASNGFPPITDTEVALRCSAGGERGQSPACAARLANFLAR